MRTIYVKENEIRFGIQMNVFPTLEIEEQEFSSKEEFAEFLKQELMNSFQDQLEFLVNDFQENFDRVIPYNKLVEFEIEDCESGKSSDLLNQYNQDNNTFFENVVLAKLIKNTKNKK
jgi:hypothetical protein